MSLMTTFGEFQMWSPVSGLLDVENERGIELGQANRRMVLIARIQLQAPTPLLNSGFLLNLRKIED